MITFWPHHLLSSGQVAAAHDCEQAAPRLVSRSSRRSGFAINSQKLHSMSTHCSLTGLRSPTAGPRSYSAADATDWTPKTGAVGALLGGIDIGRRLGLRLDDLADDGVLAVSTTRLSTEPSASKRCSKSTQIGDVPVDVSDVPVKQAKHRLTRLGTATL